MGFALSSLRGVRGPLSAGGLTTGTCLPNSDIEEIQLPVLCRRTDTGM